MSENNNSLSIDEIIKRAQQIREEATRQLQAAEKSLDDKARAAEEEIVVDETAVAKRIAKAYEEAKEEEDVKTFIPKKQEPDFSEEAEADEDMKIVPVDDKTKAVFPEPDEDMKIVPADDKTKPVLTKKEDKTKVVEPNNNESPKAKTKQVFVSRNSGEVDPENDLEKVPTLISKDKLYDGFTQENEDFEEELGIQMTFDGFDDEIEEVPKIDERKAEQDLIKRREEKIGKFRIFGPEDTDAELNSDTALADDYVNKNDKESFIDRLYSKKATTQTKLAITGVLFALLLLLTAAKNSPHLPNFLTGHTAYFVCALILFAGVIIVNFNVIAHGFHLKRGFNFDTPIALVTALVTVHTVLLTVNSSLWIDNGVLLSAVCTASLLMSQLGKQRMMARICDNFEFLTDGADKYTIENMANAVDAGVISRGLLEEEAPQLKYSVKTDFPTNFLEIACKREPADKIARRIFAVTALLSAALLVTVGLLDNFNTGVNTALCALTVSLPCAALFLTNTVLCDISAQLSRYGSRVSGFEGAVMAEDTDAIVMEAADLFDKNSCDLHGVKTFGGAKIDDALLYIASVIVQTKSPLRHVFDEVIIGRNILPKVEGVQYEERLGTSAWVYKRKVLVGTRELLIHHGVNVPKESYEKKYTIKDRKAVYLAIGGEIIAMFIVSYSADPDLKRELSKLERTGKTIIVKSTDPYINEESIAKMFDLPEGFIRVMNYSAARVYDKYSSPSVEKSPAYLSHSGTALSLVSAMRGAGMIVGSRGLISFLCTFGSILGFAVIALLAFLESYGQITAVSMIIFQAIWIVFTTIVTKLRCIGL